MQLFQLTLMKGDKGVKIVEKLRDCSLLLDVRKNDLSLERIFCGYLHVVFCTFVDEWVHIIIHSGILLKINLDKFWIGTLFWLVNGI